jgi:nickel/cobalt exporter
MALIIPAIALGHPLGNFTINHYAGIRVGNDAVLLDVVVDRAEIPAFQERQQIDTNRDGEVSDAETEAARIPQCQTLAGSLDLAIAGRSIGLELTAAGLSFPPGAGGLSTMRVVCEFRASLSAPLQADTPFSFADRSDSERIGWREIVVSGDNATISSPGLPTSSVSARLTVYPQNLLTQPLDIHSATFTASPGGSALAPFVAPDAQPLAVPGGGIGGSAHGSESSALAGPAGAQPVTAAAVPGGVGSELSGLFETSDLTPLVLAASLLAAVLLGAGHALTPGHGKTIMAAYLVGTRGTAVHALGLGLVVTVSHTLGIVILALIILAAGAALPPEAFQRIAPVVSAGLVLAIGAWLLGSQVRTWQRRRVTAADGHVHAEDASHHQGHVHASEHDQPTGHDHDHPHQHGVATHTHEVPGGTRVTWRGLFALGLAGGIVPSTNALIILLSTIASGRPALGLVLVIAFGVGMATVMAGVGLALVHARRWLDRLPAGAALERVPSLLPVATSCLVLGLGLWLTSQALVGRAPL